MGRKAAVLDLASFAPYVQPRTQVHQYSQRIGPPTSTPVSDPRVDLAPSPELRLYSSQNPNSSLPIVNLLEADPTLSAEPRAPDLHSSQNLNLSWPIISLPDQTRRPLTHQIFTHHKI